MKNINYALAIILAAVSPFQMFLWAEDDLGFVLGFIIMIASVIFFLFAIIEERNEEISELREKIYNIKKHFMID